MVAFVAWLLGKTAQKDLPGSERSFRRRIAWCWNIPVPQPAVTGEIYRQIIVDGTYFSSWCVLVAHNGRHVIGWQWCASENKAAWGALIRRFPAPDVVVTDGGHGLRSALDTYWRRTRIQRCFFHIFASVRRHTTLNPKLAAGQEILALTRQLMAVHDLDAAAAWMGAYASWEARWTDFLKQRTYAKNTIERPAWAKANQTWWWTHITLRRVQGLYRNLIRDKALFTYLDPAYLEGEDRTVERTTSRIEGAINAAIKNLLRHHRGLPEAHARTAIDWLLNSFTEHPHDPWKLTQQHLHARPQSRHPAPVDEPIGPAVYDTGLTAEEGLWTRKGWAERT